MTTSPITTLTDELLAEIESAADAFPDYEWDSNQTEFFNGPSGESLGGGSTGLYCVYGPAYEVGDEMYDGPTLVEACPLDQAKFICRAKTTIKTLLANIADLKQSLADADSAHKMYAAKCVYMAEDVERIGWLDTQCEGYGFEGVHEGNRWVMDGPFATVRQAIDTAIQEQAK